MKITPPRKLTISYLLLLVKRILNGTGRARKCYICRRRFRYFTKYNGGVNKINELRRQLDMVGSDADNFGCMYCGSHDRERHLFMYFDELMLWDCICNRKILHFAPEKHLSARINQQNPAEYVKADLNPRKPDVQSIDATSIPFEADTFDCLIANHVLEHIPDYRKALSEFHRVLKPGGFAVLQTPFSKLLKGNFEDEGINTDKLRQLFHGQEDHVRTFGEHKFLESLVKTGFHLQLKKHSEYFKERTSQYYGVPLKEDLILVVKPHPNC